MTQTEVHLGRNTFKWRTIRLACKHVCGAFYWLLIDDKGGRPRPLLAIPYSLSLLTQKKLNMNLRERKWAVCSMVSAPSPSPTFSVTVWPRSCQVTLWQKCKPQDNVQSGCIPGIWLNQHMQINKCNTICKKIKGRSHMIINSCRKDL